jgi:hypothetical protein
MGQTGFSAAQQNPDETLVSFFMRRIQIVKGLKREAGRAQDVIEIEELQRVP